MPSRRPAGTKSGSGAPARSVAACHSARSTGDGERGGNHCLWSEVEGCILGGVRLEEPNDVEGRTPRPFDFGLDDCLTLSRTPLVRLVPPLVDGLSLPGLRPGQAGCQEM